LPPAQSFLSNSTTSWPLAPSTQAAANPPSPPPIIATFITRPRLAAEQRPDTDLDRPIARQLDQRPGDARGCDAADIVAAATGLGRQAQPVAVELAAAVQVLVDRHRIAAGLQARELHVPARHHRGLARPVRA